VLCLRAYNSTKKILLFDLANTWHSGQINWTLSGPVLQESANVSGGASLLVFIEDATINSNAKEEISAVVSSYTDYLWDVFSAKPLKISSLMTLDEGDSNIFELVIASTLNQPQNVSVNFGTGYIICWISENS